MRQSLSTSIFSIIVLSMIAIGLYQRDQYWLTAEKGWGYILGIIGGVMMLILLLYPVRKHWKLARNWFSIRHWFKMHMMLGILGPLLILFHSNFHLGSLNSNIALFSMLLVSGSGLIGRYAYQKIHRGLYGEKIKFKDLTDEFNNAKLYLKESLILSPEQLDLISNIEQGLNKAHINIFSALNYDFKIKSILKSSKNKLERVIKQLDQSGHDSIQKNQFIEESKGLMSGLKQLKKMTSHSFYAKLFSLWHLFHLPIFFMMIIAAIIHVIVVHMY